MIWDPVERAFYAVYIVLLFIVSCFYFYKGIKAENKENRFVMLGFFLMAFGLGIAEVIFFLCDLSIQGEFIESTFYGEVDLYQGAFLYKLGWVIQFSFMGVSWFLLETAVKRTKYLITLITIAFMIPVILAPSITVIIHLIISIYVIIHTAFFVLLIVVFSKWAPLNLRGLGSVLLIGFFFLLCGAALNTSEAKIGNEIPLSIPHIIASIGCIIWIASFLINPEVFKQEEKFRKFFVIFILFWDVFLLIVIIFSNFPIQYAVIFIFATIIGNTATFFSIRYLNPRSKLETPLKGEEVIQLKYLGFFTRPKKITEEEVSISKEKKICLVCKGQILRHNFVCPECQSFYCDKCYKALTNLENACWACDTALDASKPIKLDKKEEPVAEIDEESFKRKKK